VQLVLRKNKIIPNLLWLLELLVIARMTVMIRKRDLSEYASVDTSALFQIIIVGLLFLFIVMGSRHRGVLSQLQKTSILWLILYYLLSCASSLWSPMPLFSLYRAVEFLVLFSAVSVALSYSRDFPEAERRVLFFSAIVTVLDLFTNVIVYGYSLSLIDFHTNSYSASAAMLFCYCFGEYLNASGRRAILLRNYGMFSLGIAILGTSTTSYIAILAGIVVVLFLSRRLGLLLTLVLTGVLIYLYTEGLDYIISILSPGKSQETILTMTGRSRLYAEYNDMVAESPYIGHGFSIGSRIAEIRVQSTHNFIYSILLGTGALGMVLFVLYLLKLFRESLRTSRNELIGAVGCAGALCSGITNSLAIPFICDAWIPPSFVYAAISALFALFVYLPHYYAGRANVAAAAHNLRSRYRSTGARP